jgi:metal-dependent HD superfamily phosphatase/phosphodiesterase
MSSKLSVTLEKVKASPLVHTLIAKADSYLETIGYTEHGFRHAGLVSSITMNVLKRLGKDERLVELAGIAGYIHDIGNVTGRRSHAEIGAVLAFDTLKELGMAVEDAVEVMVAIANHDEPTGIPVSDISSALILADKSDVHRSRVRLDDPAKFDIHDRVNFAVTSSFLRVTPPEISLELVVDTSIGSVMDYFEIFFPRLVMTRKATEYLGCVFHLDINKQRIW